MTVLAVILRTKCDSSFNFFAPLTPTHSSGLSNLLAFLAKNSCYRGKFFNFTLGILEMGNSPFGGTVLCIIRGSAASPTSTH